MKKIILIIMMLIMMLSLCGFKSVNELTDEQKAAHAAANVLREYGIAEDHKLIQSLQQFWWECEAEKKEVEEMRTYSSAEVAMLAKTVYLEARGLNQTEQAAVVWCVLNRVDNWDKSIEEVVTAPNQFAYTKYAPVKQAIVDLVIDVLDRWCAEKAGVADVGRVLDKQYMWFTGDGKHNYFRNAYMGGTIWNWTLQSPYEMNLTQ